MGTVVVTRVLRRGVSWIRSHRRLVPLVAIAGVGVPALVGSSGSDVPPLEMAASAEVIVVPDSTPDPEPTVTPSPTPTSTPTPTPTPTPWMIPTPTPSPDSDSGAPKPPAPSTPIYVGTVARLGLDDPVVAPVADQPPAVAAGLSPLTGLPAVGPIGRPAILAKFDNVPAARPQQGIATAEIVYEEMVEGGLTRFAAVILEPGGGLGPIRSGRTTDIGIAGPLNVPLFAYSGANFSTEGLLAGAAIVNRGPGRASYWRSTSRRAPHDLMTDVSSLRSGTGGAPPPTMFVFDTDTDTDAGTSVGSSAVGSFTARFPATSATWAWDGAGWLRSQNGTPHLDASGRQIRAANVIVQRTRYIESGLGTPEGVTVGTGSATVYTNGAAIPAVWTRPTLRSVTTYTDANGNHIPVTPGITWIELVP